jgi:cell division protein FtsQ
MKRPEGFDNRQPPREPPAPEPRRRPFRKQDPATQEAPPAARTERPAERQAERPADPQAERPAQRPKDRPETSDPTAPSGLPERTGPATPAAETPAAARRRLRKAARARRRFEHAEVRRFTRRTRRRRATWVTVAAIVAALGLVLAVAIYSPILALREITVDGTSRIDQADVQSAVRDQLGTPLALIDFGEIRSDLAAFPLIRSYVTETVPPNTLRIHIVEREPIGVVSRGNNFDQVDPAGVVVASSSDRPELPLITMGDGGVESRPFTSAVEVLLAMPETVRGQVDTITANTADDVAITLRGTSPRVVWGSADNSEEKATVLTLMLARPECATQVVIDVSAPMAPICGPK